MSGVYDYAVRYCLGRRSYAFADGLDIAEAHWSELAEATRADLVTRCQSAPLMAASLTPQRHPTIWKHVYPNRRADVAPPATCSLPGVFDTQFGEWCPCVLRPDHEGKCACAHTRPRANQQGTDG